MELQEGICSNCNKHRAIVNRGKTLCDNCNYQRLHSGKTKEDIAKEKIKIKESKMREISLKSHDSINHSSFQNKRVKIKAITAKQSNLNKQLSQIKNEIALEAIQNDEYFCKGCGSSSEIDKSHILSIGQRKDLELVKENIQLLCRRCHIKWESGNYEKMSSLWCFDDNMEYIASIDLEKYHKIVNKNL